MLFFFVTFCWRRPHFLLGSPKAAVLLGIRRSELDHNAQCLNLRSCPALHSSAHHKGCSFSCRQGTASMDKFTLSQQYWASCRVFGSLVVAVQASSVALPSGKRYRLANLCWIPPQTSLLFALGGCTKMKRTIQRFGQQQGRHNVQSIIPSRTRCSKVKACLSCVMTLRINLRACNYFAHAAVL